MKLLTIVPLPLILLAMKLTLCFSSQYTEIFGFSFRHLESALVDGLMMPNSN